MAQLKVFDIIKRPHTSLKAAILNKGNSPQLVIIVDKHATKPDIKMAVKTLFGVEVVSVNTLIVKGKKKRSAGRHVYCGPDLKKAIVTLKQGQQIGGLEASASMSDVESFASKED